MSIGPKYLSFSKCYAITQTKRKLYWYEVIDMELLKRRLSELEHVGQVDQLRLVDGKPGMGLFVDIAGHLTEPRLRAVADRLGFHVESEDFALSFKPKTDRKTINSAVRILLFKRELNHSPTFSVVSTHEALSDETREKVVAFFKALAPNGHLKAVK